MRTLLLLALATAAAAEDPLPADVAAQHPEGKWTVRRERLYRYLVDYYGATPDAKAVLPDYMRQRLIDAEARRRGITVTAADVEAFRKDLDEKVRTEGGRSLEELRELQGMSAADFQRRLRMAVVRERLARAIYREKDPTRDPAAEIPEDLVSVAMAELYDDAEKEVDRSKLPDGIVARIGDVEITAYEYGRELLHSLPASEVLGAIKQLVLVEEVNLLLGPGEPTAEELAAQKEWFMEYERNRIQRHAGTTETITDDMVRRVVESRGLTLEQVFANPSFLAQARARGHFRKALGEEEVRAFYDANRARYGDKLRVQRVFIEARGQRQVQIAGRKLRTLEQGRALIEALHLQLKQGKDFHDVAEQHTDDPEEVKRAGGVLPFWLTGDNPMYEDTYRQASELKVGEVSRPYFSRRGGYMIAKLLERREMPGFEALRAVIRNDAADSAYDLWRVEVTRKARRLPDLFERGD